MAIEEKYNFKKFIQRIYVSKNIVEIYNMWTVVELIEKWYVVHASYHTSDGRLREKNENIKINDEYEWKWVDGAMLHGRILQADGKENLSFTFGNSVIVTLNFKDINGNKTLIELTQEQSLDSWESNFQNYMACFPGWSFYLINLKSVCEGGLDLRETNPNVELLVNI